MNEIGSGKWQHSSLRYKLLFGISVIQVIPSEDFKINVINLLKMCFLQYTSTDETDIDVNETSSIDCFANSTRQQEAIAQQHEE